MFSIGHNLVCFSVLVTLCTSCIYYRYNEYFNIELGKPLHNCSMGISYFIYPIFSILSPSFFSIFIQGNVLLRKYIIIYPRDSRSSFLLYSIPKWAARLAYLVVPMKESFSFYFFFDSKFLAIPKSIRKSNSEPSYPKIFSGFKSRWITFLKLLLFHFICICSKTSIICFMILQMQSYVKCFNFE